MPPWRRRRRSLTHLTKPHRLELVKSVSTHEAKTHLSRILDEVSKGEVYLITRNGRPIAELRGRPEGKRTEPHRVLSHLRIRCDPTEDLSPEEWGRIE